jgi:hypothetical protein
MLCVRCLKWLGRAVFPFPSNFKTLRGAFQSVAREGVPSGKVAVVAVASRRQHQRHGPFPR